MADRVKKHLVREILLVQKKILGSEKDSQPQGQSRGQMLHVHIAIFVS